MAESGYGGIRNQCLQRSGGAANPRTPALRRATRPTMRRAGLPGHRSESR